MEKEKDINRPLSGMELIVMGRPAMCNPIGANTHQ